MPAYLVRTTKEHDLVGVFFASNLRELAFLVDEVLDPDQCEYQNIGPGGVVWTEPAVRIPLGRATEVEEDQEEDAEDEADDSDGIPWSEAAFTEVWGYWTLYEKGRWRKITITVEELYGIDPETPDPDPPPPRSSPPRTTPAGKVLPFRRRTT